MVFCIVVCGGLRWFVVVFCATQCTDQEGTGGPDPHGKSQKLRVS